MLWNVRVKRRHSLPRVLGLGGGHGLARNWELWPSSPGRDGEGVSTGLRPRARSLPEIRTPLFPPEANVTNDTGHPALCTAILPRQAFTLFSHPPGVERSQSKTD